MERETVEAGIRTAFAGVKLGAGVSLRQAQAADTWRDGHTEAEWRALPRGEVTDDWSRVPDAELRRDCIAYLDEEGLRYYLPAFMLWLLDHYDDVEMRRDASSDLAVIGTLMATAPGGDGRAAALHAAFDGYTPQRRAAIAAFVEALPRLVELSYMDAMCVERAIRDYWGQFLPGR
jgi:hypothetical protein